MRRSTQRGRCQNCDRRGMGLKRFPRRAFERLRFVDTKTTSSGRDEPADRLLVGNSYGLRTRMGMAGCKALILAPGPLMARAMLSFCFQGKGKVRVLVYGPILERCRRAWSNPDSRSAKSILRHLGWYGPQRRGGKAPALTIDHRLLLALPATEQPAKSLYERWKT